MFIQLIPDLWDLLQRWDYSFILIGFAISVIGVAAMLIFGIGLSGSIFGAGLGEIAIGTANYIFEGKASKSGIRTVYITGYSTAAVGAIISTYLLIVPIDSIILQLIAIFLFSYGISVLVCLNISTKKLALRHVYIIGLIMFTAGIAAIYFTVSSPHYLKYIYLGAIPVLTGGLIIFSGLNGSKHRKRKDYLLSA